MAVETRRESTDSDSISRRDFLSSAAIGVGVTLLAVDTVLAAKIIIDQESLRDDSVEVESNYARIVENRFGIRLTYEQGIAWADSQILILGEVLSHLPSAIYAPNGEEPLQVDLKDKWPDDSTCCSASYEPYKGKVTFFNRDIRTDVMDLVADTITHELAHHRSFLDGRIAQSIAEEIVGGDFQAFSVEKVEELAPLVNELPEYQTEDSLKQYLLRRINYGLKSSDELVAVLSEIYTYGKPAFSSISQWFGEEEADAFYELVKDQIFEGREYKNHKELEGKLKFNKKGKPVMVGFLGIGIED